MQKKKKQKPNKRMNNNNDFTFVCQKLIRKRLKDVKLFSKQVAHSLYSVVLNVFFFFMSTLYSSFSFVSLWNDKHHEKEISVLSLLFVLTSTEHKP